jgi:hypothetical protein
MPRNLKIAAVVFLLFAAVVVDFISGFMSIMFDAVFVGGAGIVLYSMLKNDKE